MRDLERITELELHHGHLLLELRELGWIVSSGARPRDKAYRYRITADGISAVNGGQR